MNDNFAEAIKIAKQAGLELVPHSRVYGIHRDGNKILYNPYDNRDQMGARILAEIHKSSRTEEGEEPSLR